jgi:hypothetical protein
LQADRQSSLAENAFCNWLDRIERCDDYSKTHGLGATTMLGTSGRAALFDLALCRYQVKSSSCASLFVRSIDGGRTPKKIPLASAGVVLRKFYMKILDAFLAAQSTYSAASRLSRFRISLPALK